MKEKTLYLCSDCGHTETKWLGRCPACGAWNTFQETATRPGRKAADRATGKTPVTVPLSRVEAQADLRFDSGIEEFNRVLGGGIMRGGAVLLGGEPGIGKSTLMLMIAAAVKTQGRVVVVSGEESPAQIRMRAERIGALADRIEIAVETEMDAVMQILTTLKPVLVIVDSIQTLKHRELGPVSGTVNQMKFAAQELIDWAKLHTTALFLIGHVTKEGSIAGPKVIEHMVDTVLQFEPADQDLRFLRVAKNRFGSVDEIGIFQMAEDGLHQIKDSGGFFLEKRQGALPPGIVVAPVYEGSRVLLVELQSLAAPAKGGVPRVFSDRIDPRLVYKAQGVLEKHCGVQFGNYDVYVNVAGGLSIKEVGIELPLCLSLFSSRMGVPFPEHTVVCGEVSLAGEIRAIKQLEKRRRTASELGFSRVVGPPGKEPESGQGEYRAVATLAHAVRTVFGQ
ncbi:MAG TPA: DNA repair protein RadA [Spirochaetia bacterium]|nr:DNA repair protein RadA [Spirochaetia bacterium]